MARQCSRIQPVGKHDTSVMMADMKLVLEEMKQGTRNVMKIILTTSKPHGCLALPRLPFTKNKHMNTLTELTNHFFQPALLEKHSTTLRWYYFDNQFVYLTDEAIEDLKKKLRNQESRLAKMFETKIERDSI